MSTYSDRIKVVIDVVADGANTGLQKFRTSLSEAETKTDKFKVAASGAFDHVKANAGKFALGAGAALVTFGAKTVQAFQDVALEAGAFSDQMGTSVEDSSRWLAVAKEYEVELADLQDVFANVAGKVAEGDQAISDLGVTIARDSQGRVDMSETMARIVEQMGRIEDPAERARIAAELFGEEGQRQFAELIGDAENFRAKLDDVADGQVISDDQVSQARDYRESMRELERVLSEVAITTGSALVPILTEVNEVLRDIGPVLTAAGEAVSFYFDQVERDAEDSGKSVGDYFKLAFSSVPAMGKEFYRVWDEALTGADESSQEFIKGAEGIEGYMKRGPDQVEAYTKEVEKSANAHEDWAGYIDDATDAFKDEKAAIDDAREAARKSADTFYDVMDAEDNLAGAVADADAALTDQDGTLRDIYAANRDVATAAGELVDKNLELEGVTRDTENGQRRWNEQMLGVVGTLKGPMRDEVIAYIARVNGIPEEEVTDIKAALDEGDIAYAESVLNQTARPRNVAFRADFQGKGWDVPSWYAKGTQGSQGGLAMVGEQGPELVNLPAGSQVKTAAATKKMVQGSSAPSTVVYQNFPRGTRPEDVVRAQERWANRNGPTQ